MTAFVDDRAILEVLATSGLDARWWGMPAQAALDAGGSMRTDCFQEGVEARASGKAVSDNPYGIRTDEHADWAAGWRATFDLDEDDDPASTREDAVERGSVTDVGSRRDRS